MYGGPRHLGLFSEHFPLDFLHQSRLDSCKKERVAYTIIATILSRSVLFGEIVLPCTGEQPSQAAMGVSVSLLPADNQFYDADSAQLELPGLYLV